MFCVFPHIRRGLIAATGNMDLAKKVQEHLHAKSAQADLDVIADVPRREVWLDGLRHAIPTGHSIILCFMFGPLGMLSHMTTRTVQRRSKRSFVANASSA